LLHLVLSLKTQSSSPIQLSQGSGTDGSQFIYLHTVQFLCGRFLRNCTGAVGFFATTIYIVSGGCFYGRVLRGSRPRTGILCFVRFEIEEVVDWMPEILFTAEIALGSQNRCVPKQELNLFK